MNQESDRSAKPPRRTPGPARSMQEIVLIVCTAASGGMLAGSLFTLLGNGGPLGCLKAFFCVLGGVAVSYSVNRCALDRGAPLAVVGYRSAAIASVLSILFVGAGLFGATYSSVVLGQVEQLRLEAHGTALSEHVGHRAVDGAAGSALAPVLASIADDLEKKAACESTSSCVSGRASGGRKLVARTLEALAERAKAVTEQARTDENARRLTTIPGIGALNATGLVAAIGDVATFAHGRDLAAWLGLVPRQVTTGGKPRLVGITKRGSKYLRKTLIQGARAAMPTLR